MAIDNTFQLLTVASKISSDDKQTPKESDQEQGPAQDQ